MAGKKALSHPARRVPTAPGGRWWPGTAARPAPRLAQHGAPAQAQGARLNWPRTLLAKGPQALQRAHLRHDTRAQEAAPLHLIALDLSGSMRQGGRLARAKGYAARLIEQAARAGERIALLGFGGQGVSLLLPPGPARAAGVARVRPLGGGGGTPLGDCLAEADRLLRTLRRREGAGGETCLWLLSDGRCLEQPAAPGAPTRVVVVDFDDPLRPIGRCARWAERWRAEHRLP